MENVGVTLALRSVESPGVIKSDKGLKFLGLDIVWGTPLASVEDEGRKMFWSPEYSGARLNVLYNLGLEAAETKKICDAFENKLGKLAGAVLFGRDMPKISPPISRKPKK